MKPKVAFICVHNSCRSQMAEAVSKQIAEKFFDSYSAGTHITSMINQTAVQVVKNRYQIDINKSQRSKTLEEIPEVDIVITMGCNVDCPNIKSKYREDWGLDDPTGKDISEFEKTLDIIEEKIKKLIFEIENKIIKI